MNIIYNYSMNDSFSLTNHSATGKCHNTLNLKKTLITYSQKCISLKHISETTAALDKKKV